MSPAVAKRLSRHVVMTTTNHGCLNTSVWRPCPHYQLTIRGCKIVSAPIQPSKYPTVTRVQSPGFLLGTGRILDKLEAVLENAYPGTLDGGDEMQEKRESICFLVGNQMTAPDFCLWEILDQFRRLCSLFQLPSVMETRPYLDAFFSSISGISTKMIPICSSTKCTEICP